MGQDEKSTRQTAWLSFLRLLGRSRVPPTMNRLSSRVFEGAKRLSWRLALTIGIGSTMAAGQVPNPIVTEEEVRSALAHVTVEKIEFVVPPSAATAEMSLAKGFFNRPEVQYFSGMTTASWKEKWQLFSESLVRKATEKGLDAASLERCLRALNRGRTRETRLEPPLPNVGRISGRDTRPETPELQKRDQERARERYEADLKDLELHPERWNYPPLAVVPVGAYLAKYAGGDCWIVACKWESLPGDGTAPLGHVMVWAIDAKSTATVAYATCD